MPRDPKLAANCQKRYSQAQADRGLVRKSVYIPAAAEAEFWHEIERLRRKWKREGLIPEDPR